MSWPCGVTCKDGAVVWFDHPEFDQVVAAHGGREGVVLGWDTKFIQNTDNSYGAISDQPSN